MASTSTSSVQMSFKYDVFLSFRGEDTRKNFVDHLFHALEQKGIETYKDDEKIRKGKTISAELIEAIEDSRFYIIVFSKNYASSSWCLEELVKIMECQKMSAHIAYPLFYDVEPTEVRKLYGPVGEVFKKHEKEEAAEKWREALKEAASLAGWELKTTANGQEANFIQKIIQEISLELRCMNSSIDENLVGMETRVNEVISSLETGVDDVRMIGIKGMGGAGKTTLARAVFDKISFQFEGQSFVENVREKSEASLCGLMSLQKQLLSDVLNDKEIIVSGVHEGKKLIQKKMRVRKVLIVLDDVDKIEQLEALAGGCNWFKTGSRIIITTRDEQVLVAHKGCLIRNVNLLSTEEAICLFSRHAFGKEVPVPGYKELSSLVVCYAAGLPLTIRVLGSFLCGKNDVDWKDAIERLKTIPLKETLDKLELSYMGLEEDYKEIFLDVACMLKGWEKDDAVMALESCGFRARIGLRVLEQRSLITISDDNELWMHDHIEEMGKNIVRRLNPNEPIRHSRLWNKKEIEDVLANDSGTQPATKCIRELDPSRWNFEMLMKGLANMKELRFLQIERRPLFGIEYVVSKWKLPNALRFLRWDNYPFSSLPNTFQPNYLVGLHMEMGNMVQFWKDGEEKLFPKLRFLKFTNLWDLRSLDLSVAPNLEILILELCEILVEVHFPVTPNLKELRIHNCNRLEKLHMPAESPNLTSLDLTRCFKLRTLHLGITPNLETLRLDNYTDMVELQFLGECPKLVNLYLNRFVKLRTLDLRVMPNLESLDLRYCYGLKEINAPAKCLKKLLHLNISKCARFKSFEFDKELDSTEAVSLSELHLIAEAAFDTYDTDDAHDTRICDPGITWPEFKFSCDYKEDPASSFGNLERLISLGFGSPINADSFSDIICGLQCLRKLTLKGRIPEAPKNLDRLDCLEELSLWSIDIKTLPDSICMLKHLKSLELKSCLLEKLPVDIGRLECLESLILSDCTLLQDLPNSICEMMRLKCLVLSKLKLRALHLKITLNLETIRLRDCMDMVELRMPAECPKLVNLDLDNLKLTALHLGITPNLETLSVKECTDMVELQIPSECPKLVTLVLYNLKLLMSLHLGITPKLETVSLNDCGNLVELHLPFRCLKLKNLSLNGSKLMNLHLGSTPDLETLSLARCDSLVELLMPNECPKLVNLDLGDTLNLETLSLYNCMIKNLSLDNSKLRNLHLGSTPNLERLSLAGCDSLAELHMPFRCLKLKFLSLNGSKLRNLHLGSTPDLETLSLARCDSLVELHMPNECPKLVNLDLSDTLNLEMLSLYNCMIKNLSLDNSKLRNLYLGSIPNLERLSLAGCDSLAELHMPFRCLKLKFLSLNGSKLRNLHLGSTPDLETLSLAGCDSLTELHMPFGCPKLKFLSLNGSKLRNLHLGSTPDLETLSLAGCDSLTELHMPFGCPKLKFLSLNGSKLRNLHLGSTPDLETLSLAGCDSLTELHMPFGCPKLKFLSLNGSKFWNLHLGSTPDLETLSLAGCDSLTELHMPFGCPKLKFLSLSNTKLSTLDLGLTPNLQTLDLKECHDLVEINAPFGCLRTLRYLDLTDCGRFESFLMEKRFPLVDVDSLLGLYVTVESFDVWPLHSENKSPKSWLTSFYIQHPVLSEGNLEKLISVCNVEISTVAIYDFQCLRKLTLKGRFPEVPESVVQLQGLEELILLSTEIKHLPESICMLKYLKTLELKSCWLLEKLPENLGQLQCLEKLILTECVCLRYIPDSICEMKCLKYLHLPYCIQVVELPEEIGRLECLKELDITGTGISRLPGSIFRVKGLRIVGSRWLLESCGFTSEIKTSDDETFCYI